MLKSFSISNYKCYTETVKFEFDCNVGVIFGSNASGKTNALKALDDTISLISNRSKNPDETMALFSPNDKNKPIEIRLEFRDNNKDGDSTYLYSLSIQNNTVIKEQFVQNENKDIFSYSCDINNNNKKEFFFIDKKISNELEDFFNNVMLENTTFTSIIFSVRFMLDSTVKELYDFVQKSKVYFPSNENFENENKKNLHDHIEKGNGVKSEIIRYAKLADPTIEDLFLDDNKRIICKHSNGESRPLATGESLGTNKVIQMTSVLVSMSKENSIFFFDELDVHFHPVILALWLKDIINKYPNSQIIFTAHNPMVLDYLISWKILNTYDNFSILYRDKEQQIKKATVSELVEKYELKLDNKFSNLLFDYWLQYISHLVHAL